MVILLLNELQQLLTGTFPCYEDQIKKAAMIQSASITESPHFWNPILISSLR